MPPSRAIVTAMRAVALKRGGDPDLAGPWFFPAPDVYWEMLEEEGFAVAKTLIAGAPGSGKTTTLYGALQKFNDPGKKIITIEDPVEYVHQHKGCVITHREVGVDTENWHAALKNTLRQAPDVILVGEIRDVETARLGVQANVPDPALVVDPCDGLDRGGSCKGVAFRITRAEAEAELELVWRREMVTGAYAPRWLHVDCEGRPIVALGFVVSQEEGKRPVNPPSPKPLIVRVLNSST